MSLCRHQDVLGEGGKGGLLREEEGKGEGGFGVEGGEKENPTRAVFAICCMWDFRWVGMAYVRSFTAENRVLGTLLAGCNMETIWSIFPPFPPFQTALDSSPHPPPLRLFLAS